jgi:hypothetical protein
VLDEAMGDTTRSAHVCRANIRIEQEAHSSASRIAADSRSS